MTKHTKILLALGARDKALKNLKEFYDIQYEQLRAGGGIDRESLANRNSWYIKEEITIDNRFAEALEEE